MRKIRIVTISAIIIAIIIAAVAIAANLSKNVQDVSKPVVTSHSDTSVDLSWNKVSGADGYFVYQNNSDNTYKKVATIKNSATTKYTVENLKQASEYKFHINAFKQTKKATYESKEFTEVKASTNPSKQSIEKIESPDAGLLNLEWEKNSSVAGYKIEYVEGNDFSNAQKMDIKEPSTTSYSFKGLKERTQYSVRICSYYSSNGEMMNGEWSEVKTVKVAEKIQLSSNVDPKKPMIALTFDDGPGYNSASESILDTLEKYNARATFFMVGTNAKDHPNNLKRKVKLGCELGNHTYDHNYYGSQVTANEISKCSKAIYEVTGKYPTAFRSTGGNTTPTMLAECKKENMPLYYWSLDTEDWKSRDASKVYSTVMNNVSDGDIILMHDIYESTAEAVKKMLPELIAKGYQIVTVTELVQAKTGKNPVPGQQYVTATSINNKTS